MGNLGHGNGINTYLAVQKMIHWKVARCAVSHEMYFMRLKRTWDYHIINFEWIATVFCHNFEQNLNETVKKVSEYLGKVYFQSKKFKIFLTGTPF